MNQDESQATACELRQRAQTLVEQLVLSNDANDAAAIQALLDGNPAIRSQLQEQLQKLERIEGIIRNVASTAHGSSTSGTSSPSRQRLSIQGFEVLGRIGAGGQASVFRAVQNSTGQTVAIKALYGGALFSESAKKRFDREVRILVDLNHPHIVNVIDRGTTDEGTPFVVMRYVDGDNLDEWLRKRRIRYSVTLAKTDEVHELAAMMIKICQAVDAAHQKGIVHRDLKPSNIRIDARNEPHILDFGLASESILGESQRTQTGHFVGSLPWASPEQMGAVSDPVEAPSDVFSLGLILFEMLVQALPYGKATSLKQLLQCVESIGQVPPSQFRPKTSNAQDRLPISPILDAIVLKAISLKPIDRYPTARELAADLAAFLQGQSTTARPKTAWQRYQRLAVASILVLVGVATWFGVQTIQSSTRVAPVEGYVWSDQNADGLRQSDEAGIAGIRVYLDANHNGRFDAFEASVVSDATGKYSLPTKGMPAVVRCEARDFKITFPSAPARVGSSIFSFIKGDVVRRLTRFPGELPQYERGLDLRLRLRDSLPESMLDIAERSYDVLSLWTLNDEQLIVGWIRNNDKQYLGRLTLNGDQLNVLFLGSMPLDRAIIDIGDVDGDGRIDLLMRIREGVPSNEDNWYVQVCWGKADGTFDLTTPLQPLSQQVRSITTYLEDVNGDQILDLLYSETERGGYFTLNMKVAYGNGDGTFQLDHARTLLVGPRDHGLVMRYPADLDGDGDRDLLLTPDDDTQDEGQSYVAVNQGEGKYELLKFIDFEPASESAGQDLPTISQSVVIDIDLDGHLDLLVTGKFSTASPIWLYRRIDEALAAGVNAENWQGEEIDLSEYWNRTAWPHQLPKLPLEQSAHQLVVGQWNYSHRDFGLQGVDPNQASRIKN